MAADAICQHFKFGFCKHGEKCRKQHVEDICKNIECDIIRCRQRHPRLCRYFSVFKRCKFGDYCAYNHDLPINPVDKEIKAMNEKMEALERQVSEKNREIIALLRKLEKTLKLMIPPEVVSTNNCSATLPSNNKSTKSTLALTTVTINPSSPVISSHSSQSDIPQLDGQILSQFECENCGKSFESEEMLQTHGDEHGWGCDDCLLCFTSKYLADLHELEHHAESPDSIGYIRDYIPETTKRLFALGHRQR